MHSDSCADWCPLFSTMLQLSHKYLNVTKCQNPVTVVLIALGYACYLLGPLIKVCCYFITFYRDKIGKMWPHPHTTNTIHRHNAKKQSLSQLFLPSEPRPGCQARKSCIANPPGAGIIMTEGLHVQASEIPV